MGRRGSAALAAVLMTAALPAAANAEELRLDRDGTVSSAQRVHVPRTGWYTLSARMRTSTGEIEASARLCGTRERLWAPPGEALVRGVVSARLRRGRCDVVLRARGRAGESAEFADLALAPGRVREPELGGDVSSLHKSEDLGGVYRDRWGRRGDALRILRGAGMEWARLRVWLDPADGYHDREELLRMARRARAAGQRVLVDLHYSDFWADPGKQWMPAAWKGLAFPELRSAFGAYTRDLVRALVRQGTPPDMVQIGNEINSGLLWDQAATWTGCSSADDGTGEQREVCHTERWDQLAELLKTGYGAVNSASPRTEVMLHLAEGGDNGTFRWWFDNVTARGVPFDVIGASFYPYWHGTLAELQANLDDVVARYGKDVWVAETAHPFTLADDDGWENAIDLESELTPGYPATVAGQARWLRDLQGVVRAVPGGRGLGAFWWDATWTAVPGNGWSPVDPSSGNAWENQALFGYDDRLLLGPHPR